MKLAKIINIPADVPKHIVIENMRKGLRKNIIKINLKTKTNI